MNLVQLKVKWTDQHMCRQSTIRPITPSTSEEWIDGWFAGIAEMIAYRGGRIDDVTWEPINEL